MDTYCFYNWKDTVISTLHLKLFKIKQNFPHSAAVFISLLANNFISAPWLGEVSVSFMADASNSTRCQINGHRK